MHPAAAAADGVEVVTRLEALAPDACAFLEAAESRCVEFGLAWFRNLAATVYPASAELRFYIRRRSGAVQAVIPLRAERGALGWTLHALGNFYTALYEPLCAPGCSGADLALLLAAMRRDFPGLGALRLAPMDPASAGYRLMLEALHGAGWRPYEFFSFGNWYQAIDLPAADYLAQRSGILRSTLKRAGKRFAADGGTLELVTAPQDLARAIDAYQRVYAASWKRPEPYPDFMPGLLRTSAERGSLRLGLAWMGGQPIAAQVWIVAHGKAEIYKLAYDEGYKAYASGTLLTAKLMAHAIDIDRVTEIDYLIGDDPYKQAWMRERRERWGIIAYNPRTPAGLAGWLREALGRALKAARARLRRQAAG
jgi:hypothetical protein